DASEPRTVAKRIGRREDDQGQRSCDGFGVRSTRCKEKEHTPGRVTPERPARDGKEVRTMRNITSFRRRGAGMTEYVILVGMLSILLIGAIERFKTQIDVTIRGTDGNGGMVGNAGVGGVNNGIG